MNPYEPPQAAYAPYAPGPYATGGGGAVTDAVIEALRQTRPWVLLFSILCFLGSAFSVLGGLMMLATGLIGAGTASTGSRGSSGAAAMAGGFGLAAGAFYLVIAFLYIYPGIKLWGYGSAIGRVMTSRDSADLAVALGHQKSFWKFSGIATVSMIALYFVAIIGIMVVGVALKP